MHAPFLSCCQLWYGTNGITMTLFQETLDIRRFHFKNAKIKSSSMITNTYQGHMTWFKIQYLSHMLLVWALSFVKLLWPMLRFSSCTHDQDTHTPTNKLLTLTLKVTQKHAFSVHQIITPFVYHVSLSQKFHVPKRIVWAMLKKEEKKKKNIHAKKHERKKCMPKSMKKRKEKKKKRHK